MGFVSIPGFSGYEINKQGIVRSLMSANIRYLTVSVNQCGYPIASVKSDAGKFRNVHLHRLLLTTFVRPPKNGEHGLHKDDNKLNFELDNLYWGNDQDNANDRIKNCRTTTTLTKDQIIEIRKHPRSYGSNTKLGEKYGVTRNAISKIVNRVTWRHI